MSLVQENENAQEQNIIVTTCPVEIVLLTEVIANQKLVYKLIQSQYQDDDSEVSCYGVEIECTLFGGLETSKFINITSKLELAKELFNLLCDNLVTPISLKDIVEDFITQKYSYS